MMYKFSGKRIDNGEWVYGYLIGDDVIVGSVVEFNEEYFNTEGKRDDTGRDYQTLR